MQRRHAFTLVELLVAMALIIFIMVILSETFAVALNTFRNSKAIGDMEEHLRTAATMLRRDLAADHFEGKRRTSDPDFWDSTHYQGPPREGFFRVFKFMPIPASLNEGQDDYGITSRRCVNDVLHFSIKLRGNCVKDFATANISGSPLPGQQTTFFNQPPESRYQQNASLYSTQWAEVAYFMVPLKDPRTGQPVLANGQTQLYALYRCQYVVTADNSTLNWPPLGGSLGPAVWEVSCEPGNSGLYFNNPSDLAEDTKAKPRKRAFQYPLFKEVGGKPGPRGPFDPANPAAWAATLLLTNVLSFDAQVLQNGATDFSDASFESVAQMQWNLMGLQIRLRVWDLKTAQSRQITILQDL